MSASAPFRLWIDAGTQLTADDIIGYEYGAGGVVVLVNDECENLEIPVGSSNEMAIQPRALD